MIYGMYEDQINLTLKENVEDIETPRDFYEELDIDIDSKNDDKENILNNITKNNNKKLTLNKGDKIEENNKLDKENKQNLINTMKEKEDIQILGKKRELENKKIEEEKIDSPNKKIKEDIQIDISQEKEENIKNEKLNEKVKNDKIMNIVINKEEKKVSTPKKEPKVVKEKVNTINNKNILNNININLLPMKSTNIIDYYTCTKCDSPPKILNYNIESNNLELECNNTSHGVIKIPIKDYYEKINSQYNLKICTQCNKRTLPVSHICLECNNYLCINCIANHKNLTKHEKMVLLNEINIKCKRHLNENYLMYCYDCKNNICAKCIEQKEHLNHNKDLLSEIEPTEEELKNIKKLKEEMVENRKNLMEEKAKIEKIILAIEQGIELNDMVVNTYEKYRYNYIYIYNVINFSKNIIKYFSVPKKYSTENKIKNVSSFKILSKNIKKRNTRENNDNSAYILEHKKLEFSNKEKNLKYDISEQDENSKKESDKIDNEENEDDDMEEKDESKFTKITKEKEENDIITEEIEEEIEEAEIDKDKLDEFNNKYIKNKRIYLLGSEKLVNVSNKQIDDEGFETFIGIKSNQIIKLNFSNNKIAHILPLKEACFKHLKYLDLSSNNLEDINNLYKVPFFEFRSA